MTKILPNPPLKNIEEQSFDHPQLHSFLGYHLRRASKAVQLDLSQTLKAFDLRMITFSALCVIDEYSGLRQSQFAKILEIERPNMAVIVDELENKEWVIREKIPSDKRAYALSLTPLGRAVLQKSSQAVAVHEARIFGQLTPEETAQFQKILIAIAALNHEGKL